MINKIFNYFFSDKQFLIIACILFSTLIICVWAYEPGLKGGFYFDDLNNIENNTGIRIDSLKLSELWQAMWSGHAGHLKRPIPMLSFGLDFYNFNLNPYAMKIENIVLHCLNFFLLFFLAYKLLHLKKSDTPNIKLVFIVSISCCAWLLHPINLTNVLYIVQRMNTMSAMFTILSIIFYVSGRLHQQNHIEGGWRNILIWCPLFGILGIFSKENAILIPFYIFCIELFILKFNSAKAKTGKIIKLLVIASVSAPIIFLLLFFVLSPNWFIDWYENREFTPTERLLTELRVLVWYMQMIVTPNINSMGIFLDDIRLSTSFFSPISTLISAIIIMALLTFVIYFRNKFKIEAFGISWFFAGHLLESTIIPLEIAFEHRNYLPSFGLLLAIVSFASRFYVKYTKLRKALIILAFSWLFAMAYGTHARAIHWENPISLALFDVENHPTSSRANSTAAFAYIQVALGAKNEKLKTEYAKQAESYFSTAIELEKTGLSSTIGKLVANELLNINSDELFINRLKNDLSQKKLDVSTQSALLTLKNCQRDKVCKFTNNTVPDLLKAAISNNSLNNNLRSSLMIILADHYLISENNIIKAENLIKEAISLEDKELTYRFDLANIYIGTERFDLAQNELDTIKDKDKFKFLNNRISLWQNHLSNMKKLAENKEHISE